MLACGPSQMTSGLELSSCLSKSVIVNVLGFVGHAFTIIVAQHVV